MTPSVVMVQSGNAVTPTTTCRECSANQVLATPIIFPRLDLGRTTAPRALEPRCWETLARATQCRDGRGEGTITHIEPDLLLLVWLLTMVGDFRAIG